MLTELKVHRYQKKILAKLSSTTSLRFNDLIVEGLGSEHINYHIKKLLELNLILKINDKYMLSDFVFDERLEPKLLHIYENIDIANGF